LLIQLAGVGGITTIAAAPVAPPQLIPNESARDGLSAFTGGTRVGGGSVTGRRAREIVPHGSAPDMEAFVTRLLPGKRYTVSYYVSPATATPAKGRVGDTSGLGWGFTTWEAKPELGWQKLQRSLLATKETERLVFILDTGAPRVRIDAIRVLGPLAPASGAASEQQTTTAKPRAGVIVAFQDSFSGHETGTGFNGNQRWRLAFWKYQLTETAKQPVFGVGFGRPSAFRWEDTVYDARTGDPNDPNDVTGPHNSFVDLVYRTGVFGLLAFGALVGIAIVRVGRRMRSGVGAEERATLVGLLALFAFAVVVASFNVALEGPYMSVFFWTILALLLILPVLATRGSPAAERDEADGQLRLR
jgi:hypothetical protein